ncbi:MAG: hypothetical protein SVX43_02025 [Cyanobacteriota bacterium]|nr:hypothetical protein [Cyanobacteriota bacterium]
MSQDKTTRSQTGWLQPTPTQNREIQTASSRTFKPEHLERWFSRERQASYVSRLMAPDRRLVGLTRRRAEYFVRLWAYLLLKQLASNNALPPSLVELKVPEGFISCTHREAARVFYAGQERGSDRSAGMILDKLVALGLTDKMFDGNTICLQINPVPQLTRPEPQNASLEFITDAFDPRTDAILVANFLAQNYNWMNSNITAAPHRIARLLRQWAKQYPKGMRVLRRCDNLHPVGFSLFYPTAARSEQNFFLPPRMSLHLSSTQDIDPIAMAQPGDLDCTSAFVRSWSIDRPYMQYSQVCQLLEDCQRTLEAMQQDFPNLCDLYAFALHPILEQLAVAVGFQKTYPDVVLGISWMYQSIDRFVALDIQTAIASVEFL